ncbi:MAG: ribosomal protein S18-alanine N-acetyltransferase [Rhodocyclaceae bacterium]|nr:ribosomal protein S18-alanine N-acetyltransferase [Rhodocyclaceae bacterium]MBX3668416.1 ribosomal protein S18-alanine N-acetyltransferase [Rhodocyclaceae bacterium]
MYESDLDAVIEQEHTLYEFPWGRQHFSDSLAAGYAAWVVRLDGALAGYAVVMAVLDEAHLLNLSVVKAAQGCGLGRFLLDWLLRRARDRGGRQMFLEVRPSNSVALALYESCGFTSVGRRPAYYPARDGREDGIVMLCSLAA